MKTFTCTCGNTLFFSNTACVRCGKQTALCPACRQVAPLNSDDPTHLCCGNSACGAAVQLCENHVQHAVCHQTVLADSKQSLCRYCRLNDVIPDLSGQGNLQKWQRIEAAKARVLYGLEQLGLDWLETDSDGGPQLRFEFKADGFKSVSTGHAGGCITLNLREADSVEREKTRVQFGEPQRTLVGHLRHELGHYFWDLIVKTRCVEEFRTLFGDERSPSYSDAQRRYYDEGPRDGWSKDYISAYASMHPWEDFAETFAGYLDMGAIVATARHFEITQSAEDDFKTMFAEYRRIGIVANELNRDLGLLDLVPVVFTSAVTEKLTFLHELRQRSKTA